MSFWTTGQAAGKVIITFGEADKMCAQAVYMDAPEAAALAEQINGMPIVRAFLKERRELDDDEH